jgi:transcriptional regulator with XRE-family HTH domain
MDTGRDTPTGGQGSRCRGVVSGFVLKLARQSAGLTQERFAEAANADLSTVQAWESGRRSLTALRAADFIRLRNLLTRAGAPPATGRHLQEAVEADLVISSGVESGARWVDRHDHPLAAGVHRRSLTNLITWPMTGHLPAQLRGFASKIPRRGPAASCPILHVEERVRFFDHLRTVADQASQPQHTLLRRQVVYLLGFDERAETASWLRAEWQRASRRKAAVGDVTALLGIRSASVALASTGDGETLQHFVATMTTDQAEMANLNYWAYWIGELAEEQVVDDFMLSTDPRTWGGIKLLSHLTQRLDPHAPQLSLNLHTLHSLVSLRPSLLSEWPGVRGPLALALERVSSQDSVPRGARDQVAGLHYAVSIADR